MSTDSADKFIDWKVKEKDVDPITRRAWIIEFATEGCGWADMEDAELKAAFLKEVQDANSPICSL